jgi:predicted nuclease with RNAse H fold
MRGPRTISAAVLSDDPSIQAAVIADEPDLVVIDAPLSLPRGRATIDDRSGPHFRACDRELQRMGIRFFPITLGPMRMLTSRGMALRSSLEREGFRVIEGYPGGSQDRLGLPRKQAGAAVLQRALLRRGLGGVLLERMLSHDELDAVTIAWTGYLYLGGRGLVIGDPEEGEMLLPSPRGSSVRRSSRVYGKPSSRSSPSPPSRRAISARVCA